MKRAREDAREAEEPPLQGQAQEQTPKKSKRKVALLLAYNGRKYQGLQANPGAHTIELVLEQALHKAGCISESNAGDFSKLSWQRAGRTDKGVHAIGQVITCKLMFDNADVASDVPRVISRVNDILKDSEIKLIDIIRVQNSFDAYKWAGSRQYEYLFPAYLLRVPRSEALKVQPARDTYLDALNEKKSESDVRAADTEIQRQCAEIVKDLTDVGPLCENESAALLGALSSFLGTHSFHNFTQWTAGGIGNKTNMRYMISVTLGAPVELDGVSFVRIQWHGQSFLLHQIRKMSCFAIMSARSALGVGVSLPDDHFEMAFREKKVGPIPKAPPCPLILRRVLYDGYEKKLEQTGASLSRMFWGQEIEDRKEAFLKEGILPHIALKNGEGEFFRFLNAMENFEMNAESKLV